MMVTLHEATSLLNNANGFTVRRKGQHPNLVHTPLYDFRRRRKANEECIVKHTERIRTALPVVELNH